ncbi:MAG: ion transporter [Bacteroidota bacterium]|nr:ion transporter [Bacteroidota bacterium]
METNHNSLPDKNLHSLKDRIHEVIFESDTQAGKNFDVALLITIVLSVMVVIVETIPAIHAQYYEIFTIAEWIFTIFFTLEYLLRIYTVKKPVSYIFSFFGIVDLIAILPTYLSLFYYGSQYLLVIRALRLLRVFRIFKLSHFLKGQDVIMRAIRSSMPKILVFLTAIIIIVTIIGAIMYLIESSVNPGFSSIPQGIYWAVTTLTTVGFGDITPHTALGRFFSMIVMIMGYAIIAVPTGIISAEFMRPNISLNSQVCSSCGFSKHEDDALYCKKCGTGLKRELGNK